MFFSAALHYLISWPEEGDAMSIIPGQKIASPSAEELTDGCMCKVKGFENNLAKVVARGSKSEMNRKLDEIEGAEPPKKSARLEG